MADFVRGVAPLPVSPPPKPQGVQPGDIANLVFGEGTLQYTAALNGGLSININYNAVSADKIGDVRSKFQKGNLIGFFKNTFQVTNYTETVDRIVFQGKFLFNYNVSVSLESLTFLNASKDVDVSPVQGVVSSQSIAAKAGFQYNGFDFQINNVPKKQSFNFVSLLQERTFQFERFFVIKNDALKLIVVPVNAVIPDRVTTSPLQSDASNLVRFTEITVEDNSGVVDPLANAPSFTIATQEVNFIAEGDPNPHICPIQDWYDESGLLVGAGTIGSNHPPIFGTIPPSYSTVRNLSHWINAARLLHYNFDQNGITRNYKLTKKIGDTTIEEEELTYGFIFSCYRLAVDGGNPANYWRLVRYQKTTYTYEPLKQPTLGSTIDTTDPETGNPIKAVVDSSILQLIATNPPKYLTRISTEGWRYVRFVPENYSGSTHDIDRTPGAPETIYWGYRATGLNFPRVLQGTPPAGWLSWVRANLDISLWRRSSFQKETVYELIPRNAVFADTTEPEVELIKVPSSLLQGSSNLPVDSDGFVTLAFVNPNTTVLPYLIISETTSNNDILWRSHPLTRPYNNDAKLNYNADPNINLSGYSIPNFYNPTLPPYVLGESNKTVVTRKVIPNLNTVPTYKDVFAETLISQAPPDVTINLPLGGYNSRQSSIDIYLEREEISNLEVREADFPKEVIEVVNREIQGIPPEAEILQSEFVQKPIAEIPKPPLYKYTSRILTEPLNLQTEIKDETISITEPNILAQSACDFYYKQKLLFESTNYTIGYDGGEYLKYRPGQLLQINFENEWVIKETRLNIAFNGNIIVAESIELSLGDWFNIISSIVLVPPTTNPINTAASTASPLVAAAPNIAGVPFLDNRSSEPHLSIASTYERSRKSYFVVAAY